MLALIAAAGVFLTDTTATAVVNTKGGPAVRSLTWEEVLANIASVPALDTDVSVLEFQTHDSNKTGIEARGDPDPNCKGDRLQVTNNQHEDHTWSAKAVWNREGECWNSQWGWRALRADQACVRPPYSPFNDISEICWDWTTKPPRGHVRVGSNRHCIAMMSQRTVHEGRTFYSWWENTGCTWP